MICYALKETLEKIGESRERERERMVSDRKRMEPHIRHDILLLLFSKFTQDIDDSFHISQFSPSFIMPLKTCLVNNNSEKNLMIFINPVSIP